MSEEPNSQIDAILHADSTIQHLLRINWPESWLRINLPFGSTRALLAVEGFDARTPSAVADVLGISRTTVTGLLDRLEAEGLLTRSIDPTNRRSIKLQVTEQGRALLHQIERFWQEQLGQALGSLTLPRLQRSIPACVR